MWTADWLVRLRCGIVAVVIIMAAAFECFPQAESLIEVDTNTE